MGRATVVMLNVLGLASAGSPEGTCALSPHWQDRTLTRSHPLKLEHLNTPQVYSHVSAACSWTRLDVFNAYFVVDTTSNSGVRPRHGEM